MGIVQTAISKLLAPTVEQAVAAALAGHVALTEADRTTLDKAASLVAEFEQLAEGQITPPAGGGDGGITLPGIDQ